MSIVPVQPVVFISYSHKDEPKQPLAGDICWRSYIQSHLQPALRQTQATYEVFTDETLAPAPTGKPQSSRNWLLATFAFRSCHAIP
jgi:hypothetical protein